VLPQHFGSISSTNPHGYLKPVENGLKYRKGLHWAGLLRGKE
jgi:hypothetical protein